MRRRWMPFLLIYGSVIILIGCSKQNDFTELKGPYLGQTPPGMMPEIFAPGIVTTEKGEMGSVFSPDGKQFVYLRYDKAVTPRTNAILMRKMENGVWSPEETLPFCTDYFDWETNFAPDNRSFYFASFRPAVIHGKTSERANIWRSVLSDDGWSEPELLEYPVNTAESNDQYPAFTQDGTLYFFSNRKDGFGNSDLYRSCLQQGQYSVVENLGSVINTEYSEFDPYIDPDEKYILFSSDRPGAFHGVDLYVSFRSDDDAWSDPVNLGREVNSVGGVCPFVSPDGNALFFTGGGNAAGSDIYWVDTKIFEQFK